jgi:hypothetical protein
MAQHGWVELKLMRAVYQRELPQAHRPSPRMSPLTSGISVG